MTEASDHVICTNCRREFDAAFKKDFLGFKKYHCPHCNEDIRYPLTTGYLVTYWVLVALLLLWTVAALSSGGVVIPGVIGILIIFAAIKDLVLRSEVRKLVPYAESPATLQVKHGCGAVLNVPEKYAGKSVKCPKCGQSFQVEAPAKEKE